MPNQLKVNAAPMSKPKPRQANQELFDMFVLNGMELVYDENQAKSMLPRLSSNENPSKAMAELLVDIIVRITSSAKAAGKKIPPEIVLHGGNLIFAELLKVLEAAGMEPLTEEQKAEVWQIASSLYIDQAIKSGEMTEQELIALSKEVEQTEEGQKVMKTAENPVAAIKDIKSNDAQPAQPMLDASAVPETSADAIAAPAQGGI